MKGCYSLIFSFLFDSTFICLFYFKYFIYLIFFLYFNYSIFFNSLGLGIDIVVIPETPRDSPVGPIEAPEITEKPKDLQITEEETAKFSFKVKNADSINVRWMKDGKPLILSNRIKTEQKENTLTLMIENANINDEALYECYISNDSGEVRCEMELLVDGMSLFMGLSSFKLLILRTSLQTVLFFDFCNTQ